MADPVECRIVVEPRLDGRSEIFLFDPRSLRTAKPGVLSYQSDVDKTIRELKSKCEKNGLHVTVKMM